MELPLTSNLACNSTPSAQPLKAITKVSLASLTDSASRIRLSSFVGSKSRGFLGDTPARSPIITCSASLNFNGAPIPKAPAIGIGGPIVEVKKVTKETNVSIMIKLD